MIYGYARCSTNESRQDITRQTNLLKEYGVAEENIYYDYISGTSNKKVNLNRLLSIVSEGDTIVVNEVSRVSRSTKQLCDIIELIKDKHLKLVIQNSITIDCTNGTLDPMSQAFLQMAGVFAELERNMISQRVKEGMDNAKDNGKVIGRPHTSKDDIEQNESFMKAYNLYKQGSITKMDIHKLTNLSRPCIDKYIKILESKPNN